jgi:nucleoside-diphosphate-sugar epimerase
MPVIAVTGAAGFLGTHVVLSALRGDGADDNGAGSTRRPDVLALDASLQGLENLRSTLLSNTDFPETTVVDVSAVDDSRDDSTGVPEPLEWRGKEDGAVCATVRFLLCDVTPPPSSDEGVNPESILEDLVRRSRVKGESPDEAFTPRDLAQLYRREWDDILSEVDTVIHLAGIVGDRRNGPELIRRVNVHGTISLACACLAENRRRIRCGARDFFLRDVRRRIVFGFSHSSFSFF